MTLDQAWTGVTLPYVECDFPGSEPYERTIPGWQCTACGFQVGTSGLPPRRCDCGQEWAPDHDDDGSALFGGGRS